jgi:hypothetical protein
MNLTAPTIRIKEIESPQQRFQLRLTILNKEIKMFQSEIEKADDALWIAFLQNKINKRLKQKDRMLFGKAFELEKL